MEKERNNINVNDIYMMKKSHPCGGNLWTVIKTGVDIKLKCNTCNRIIVLTRFDFLKKFKKKVSE